MPSTYLCCGKVGDNLVNYFSKDSVLLEKKKKIEPGSNRREI